VATLELYGFIAMSLHARTSRVLNGRAAFRSTTLILTLKPHERMRTLATTVKRTIAN